jgi:hypothetical protein
MGYPTGNQDDPLVGAKRRKHSALGKTDSTFDAIMISLFKLTKIISIM